MNYTEKETARLRKAALLDKKRSIYDSYVYISGERLEFMEQDIIRPQVRVMLPKTFMDVPPALAKYMYPSEFRPAVIRTNPSLTVNFAFTLFDVALPASEAATCARFYLATMKKMYPGNHYLDHSEHFTDEEETRVLGWYSFSNPTIAEPIFNIHAFTSVEGRLLYCIFHTSEEKFEEWTPYAFEVFNSTASGRRREGTVQ